jgi:hypothetical protein
VVTGIDDHSRFCVSALGAFPPTAGSRGIVFKGSGPKFSLKTLEVLADICRMPSPRLFGFRPARKRTVDASEEQSPQSDVLERLADKVFDTCRELPKSGAWGLSPAENYVQRRINPRN